MSVRLAPSILSADFAALGDAIQDQAADHRADRREKREIINLGRVVRDSVSGDVIVDLRQR